MLLSLSPNALNYPMCTSQHSTDQDIRQNYLDDWESARVTRGTGKQLVEQAKSINRQHPWANITYKDCKSETIHSLKKWLDKMYPVEDE